MKVRVIKNEGLEDFNKYLGLEFEAKKDKHGNYILKVEKNMYETIWLKDEIEELKWIEL